jgi:hypothetical protein
VNANYGSSTHGMRVYSSAFNGSMVLYGDANAGFATEMQRTIVHEIGHAVDFTPLRETFLPDYAPSVAVDDAVKDRDAVIKNGDEIDKKEDAALLAYNNEIPVLNIALKTYWDAGVTKSIAALNTGVSDAHTATRTVYDTLFTEYETLFNNKKTTEAGAVLEKCRDLEIVLNGGVTSSKKTLIGLNDQAIFTATPEQCSDMIAVVQTVTEIDPALVNTSVNAIGNIPVLITAKDNSKNFHSALQDWANGKTNEQPALPPGVDPAPAAPAIAEVQKFRALSETYDQLAQQLTANNALSTEKNNAVASANTNLDTNRLGAHSLSGYGQGYTEKTGPDKTITREWGRNPEERVESSPFSQAAAKDFNSEKDVIRPTEYSKEKWAEFFAESFSLYLTDPQTLSLLRPHLYTYFEVQYHRWGKAYPVTAD